eukprot:5301736-Alexandrium_andersonii.AAC.1
MGTTVSARGRLHVAKEKFSAGADDTTEPLAPRRGECGAMSRERPCQPQHFMACRARGPRRADV